MVAQIPDINSGKILSKETLNNRELIETASGIDPLTNTKEAYKEAYRVLGIDFVNRVPIENCDIPLQPGSSKQLDENYMLASLGLYDTCYRYKYPYNSVDSFLDRLEEEPLDYYELRTPVPHKLDLENIRLRERTLGNNGSYYHMLYTTLFMWGIEHLGMNVYLQAIGLDPDYVDRYFLQPAIEQTKQLTRILLQSSNPYLFFHDDLATSTGLMCQSSWMEKYIFPRYSELWQMVHEKNKQVIFVCDGNIESILPQIADTGVDGVMLESPATDFEKILEVFSDKIVIGGIDTGVLSNGTPGQVAGHVKNVINTAKEFPGFVISSCGGLHGGIRMENLEAYFDSRALFGINMGEWRFSDRN